MTKLWIGILLVLVSTLAAAQEEVKWSGALKVWNASATIKSNGGAVSYDTYSSSAGNLSLTGKKNDLLIVVSTLLPTSYNVDYTSTTGGYLRREDYDIALGYSFLPNISALIGYKTVSYKADNLSAGTYVAPYLGLTGSALISDKSFLYGTVIYAPNATDTNATFDDAQKFTSYELGMGFPVNGSTSLTFGYRSQELAHKYKTTQSWYSDSVRGVIFGINHNF